MRISEVEKLVGVSKKNIRFYEEQGLLSPGRESQNGYRSYNENDINDLRRVKLLRRLAVPIEDIRRLKEGRLSLKDCMERQTIYLRGQARNIDHMEQVCRDIAGEGAAMDSIDVEKYEALMLELEKGGVRFMTEGGGRKKERKRAAIIMGGVWIALFTALIGLMIWGAYYDPIPLPVLLILIAILLVPIGGVGAALRERLKEIDKGEEDEAFKY